MFPCSFSGVVTLSLSWTLLEVPIAMTGLVNLQDLHLKLDNQFITLCIGNARASNLTVLSCVREIGEELDTLVTQRCAELQAGPKSETERAQAQAKSLDAFRQRVAGVLGLGRVDFTGADLDQVLGWAPGAVDDPLDHCAGPWQIASATSGGDETNQASKLDWEAWIVGQFLAIDRDFLLRDVLGCVPKVKYCVTTEADEARALELLEYEARRRPHAWHRARVATSASVDRNCRARDLSNRTRVVLVRNLNRWGDPEHPHDPRPVDNVLWPLVRKWKPRILIHLSEVGSEVTLEMHSKGGVFEPAPRPVLRSFSFSCIP